MRARRAVLALVAAGALAACDTGGEVYERTVDPIATACVDGDELLVAFDECLSSSCDTVLSAVCTAEVSGDEVTVRGSVRVQRRSGACTDDCGYAVARCAVPAGVDPQTAVLRFEGDDGGTLWSEAICAER